MGPAHAADLCDVFHPENVDTVVEDKKVHIMQPLFRWVTSSSQ